MVAKSVPWKMRFKGHVRRLYDAQEWFGRQISGEVGGRKKYLNAEHVLEHEKVMQVFSQ